MVDERQPKTVNGRKLVPHDGAHETAACGSCGEYLDWTNDMYGPHGYHHPAIQGLGMSVSEWEQMVESNSCPWCGSDDTDWQYADDDDEEAEAEAELPTGHA